MWYAEDFRDCLFFLSSAGSTVAAVDPWSSGAGAPAPTAPTGSVGLAPTTSLAPVDAEDAAPPSPADVSAAAVGSGSLFFALLALGLASGLGAGSSAGRFFPPFFGSGLDALASTSGSCLGSWASSAGRFFPLFFGSGFDALASTFGSGLGSSVSSAGRFLPLLFKSLALALMLLHLFHQTPPLSSSLPLSWLLPFSSVAAVFALWVR